MADVKVTGFQFLFGGKFSDSGFETEVNEMRFNYCSASDSRFKKSNSLRLPELNDQGEVLEPVLTLSDAKVEEIKEVISKALSTIDFDPEFGPAG